MKYPGAEVAVWTILWMIAGSVVAFMTFQEGRTTLALIFAALPIACALIWFDIRAAKWIIVAYFGIAALGGVIALFTGNFSWLLLLRVIVAAYFITMMVRWQGGPNAK
jgi:hypothetical protein